MIEIQITAMLGNTVFDINESTDPRKEVTTTERFLLAKLKES